MNVSGVSNMDTVVTNQGNQTPTMEIAGETGEKETAGVTTELKFLELDKPVEFTVSKEAQEKYREMLKSTTADSNKQLKELELIRSGQLLTGFGFDPALNAAAGRGVKIEEKAENLLGAYAKLYDEISQGYDNGTRALYAYKNENGKLKLAELTKEEAIAELDRSYGKISEQMEAREKIRRREADWYDHFVKSQMEIFDVKESSGRDVAAEREAYLRGVELDKKRMENESSDIEIEGFSKKMTDVINGFKEQYGKDDIHTILSEIISEIGLFEKLK